MSDHDLSRGYWLRVASLQRSESDLHSSDASRSSGPSGSWQEASLQDSGSEEEPAGATEHLAPCRTRRAHAAVWWEPGLRCRSAKARTYPAVSSGDGSQKRQRTGEQQQAYPVEAAAAAAAGRRPAAVSMATSPVESSSRMGDAHLISMGALKMERRIGSGGSGSTYLAGWCGTKVAVKVIQGTDDSKLSEFRTEVAMLTHLRREIPSPDPQSQTIDYPH